MSTKQKHKCFHGVIHYSANHICMKHVTASPGGVWSTVHVFQFCISKALFHYQSHSIFASCGPFENEGKVTHPSTLGPGDVQMEGNSFFMLKVVV